MRKHRLAFLVLILFAARGYAAPEGWKDYTYKETMMEFSMPGEPGMTTNSLDTALGPTKFHIYVLEKGDAFLMVCVTSYSNKVIEAPPYKLLEGGRDSLLKRWNATVSSEKKVAIDGYPGLRLELAGPKLHAIYYLYMAGTRLYQIGSIADAGKPLMPGTEEFLASFHLLKNE